MTRVAAIDVAKDTGMVWTRTPHPGRPGARRAAVWTVKGRMDTIRVLGRELRKDGIEIVTLESASDYWRIWFFVLEACGLAVQLVSAAQAKNLPGRLAPFIKHAHKAGRGHSRRPGRTAAGRERSGGIRAWAKGQGIAVSDHDSYVLSSVRLTFLWVSFLGF